MEEAHRSEANDPREQVLKMDVLRNMLSREYIHNLDVEAEFTKLRKDDPVMDEIIRHFTERYFPGHVNMAQKEKVARIMLAAFRIRGRIDDTFEGLDITEVLKEIDDMTAPPLQEPPEIIET